MNKHELQQEPAPDGKWIPVKPRQEQEPAGKCRRTLRAVGSGIYCGRKWIANTSIISYADALVNAVNAALAAERKKCIATVALSQSNQLELRTQLQAKQQELDDEQKACRDLQAEWSATFDALRSQLAAAQAAIQYLIEFCHQEGIEIGDCPQIKGDTSCLDAAIAEKVKDFAARILHGDEVHRSWLTEAADAYVNGFSLPAPRSKPITDEEVNEAWSELEAELDLGFITDGKTFECGQCGGKSKDKINIKHNQGCIQPAWDKVCDLNKKVHAAKSTAIAEAMEALEKIREGEHPWCCSHPGIADAALAKHREGK